MQPLRAHHRVERTPEGENAWRSQALSPTERAVLGSLRSPQSVSDLLRAGNLSPRDLDASLVRMMRAGWVLVQEPAQAVVEDVAAPDMGAQVPDESDASELEALLSRHRAAQEDADDEALTHAPVAGVSAVPVGGQPSSQHGAPPRPAPPLEPVVPDHDPAEFLPFDQAQAENDGLLEALRHPESAAAHVGHAEEWAPPSGGLAALLRALGEPVPEGVEVSPDQEEHLQDLMPVEPWGGSFPPAKTTPAPVGPDGSFVRLRDQPTEETRPKHSPNLGAFRSSLSKVQQEHAADQAVRDRAKQLRQQREDEQKKQHQQHAQNRKLEDRVREGGTLLGLSQKLAKLKNDHEQGDT